MANCYGTKQYLTFRREQLDCIGKGELTLTNTLVKTYGKYSLEYATYYSPLRTADNFLYSRGILSVLLNGKQIYFCDDIYENSPMFFDFYIFEGNDYLIFRKDDLYGFTILNLNTLDEYNYFPDAVVNKKVESFIIVEAKLWKNILLLFGCYWGGPYIYYLLDAKTHKTHLLSNRDTDETKTVFDDKSLTVRYLDDDKPETEVFTFDVLKKLLKERTSYDI